MHIRRFILASVVAIVTLATLAGAFAWYPQQVVLSNPYPAQTAQYRAMNPYSTAYMTTGYSPLGTTGYAPSYQWTSAYTARSYRPMPMDRFGPRVTLPYDTAVVYAPRVADTTYRGTFDRWSGIYVNTFSYSYQPQVIPNTVRRSAPASRYPAGSYVQSEWY